ncbi:hypothetical protein CTAYLR_003375 [Chrysophaeum taylorii]|uniref:Ribosome biogenesis protein NOP53 n=1 Tax=Chrysophaeum taylorii TaxID=2483200 RepID=A0AAD7XM98_9STRA|nr:hypothetical protein CTAYLR_003375 [Chrysophaeum taylorii]
MPKRKDRERVLDSEYGESLEVKRFAAKRDDELFFVDNAATVPPRTAKRRLKRARNKSTETSSKTETVLVARAMAKLLVRRQRDHPLQQDVEEDPWASEGGGHARPRRWSKSQSLEALGGLAASGQSYNPSLRDHQELIREAVDIETKKIAKQEKTDQWWAARQRPLERSSSSSSTKVDEDVVHPYIVNKRPSEPVTRAQRNKHRRAREAEEGKKRVESLKEQRRQLDDSKRIRKQLDREDRERAARRAARPPKKPDEPTIPPPVALSDDILASDGTLRKNAALQNPATLLRTFRDSVAVAKHRPPKAVIERKKPPRRKYRGAKLLRRYRTPWIE